ncbi:MAG: hypothetical protein FVQ78_02930 [Solirubrobacterales bacterium]|nr:hypothetical protein [Solirubrobacterales bacterium]
MAPGSLIRIARTMGVAVVLAAALFSVATASVSEERKLAQAEADFDAANARVAELEGQLAGLEETVSAAERQATRLTAIADDAEAKAEDLADAMSARRGEAAATVRDAEAEHRQEVDDWRTQRGWALAGAVFLFLLALASALWPTLIAWPPLTRVLEQSRWRPATAVVLAVLVGLAMLAGSSTGVVLVGGALVGASVAAGIVLLLAGRARSREVAGERPSGQSPEALRRARIGFGALAGVGAAVLLVLAVALEKPAAPALPEETLALASAGDPLDNPTPELRALQDAADLRRGRADAAADRRTESLDRMSAVEDRLRDARAAARGAQRRVDRWIAALSEPDPGSEPPPPSEPPDGSPSSDECDPNYSGCVPPYPPDLDCADIGGPVEVYGSDPHGLDADGDGVGCES